MRKWCIGSGAQGTPTNTTNTNTHMDLPINLHTLTNIQASSTPPTHPQRTTQPHSWPDRTQDDITTLSCGSYDKYTYHNHCYSWHAVSW